MIEAATKYGDVRKASGRPRRTRPATGTRPPIFVPTLRGARDCLQRWFWSEIKEGGFLDRYLKKEKAKTPQMIRQVARFMAGFQQNNKSDLRRLATIPARLYHRWKEEDEQFFDDNENLRSLKRDNPELPVFVGARQLPRGRFHKSYENHPGTEAQR